MASCHHCHDGAMQRIALLAFPGIRAFDVSVITEV